ncbi:MAG: DsrE family protein [Rhizobiales bacterium]|nr:DsrE family protein [Hyphomicrobiales bacterium]
MRRRGLIAGLAGGIGALFGAAARAQEVARPAMRAGRAVYHLADFDKAGFALGAIENHIAGVPAGEADIVLVVHGPALRAFRREGSVGDLLARAEKAGRAGVGLVACGNTMKGMRLALADLALGFSVDERGGVVRIAELQAQGYAYIRP